MTQGESFGERSTSDAGLNSAPFDRWVHDVDYARFNSTWSGLTVLGGSVVVAAVAVGVGPGAAVGLAFVIGSILAIAIFLKERDRWRAQDVLHWFESQRGLEWIRDTGGEPPSGAAAAEVWLGTHPVGSVPQRYRAIVSEQTGDPTVERNEFRRLPESTAAERASREQLIQARRLSREGMVDLSSLRSMIHEMPESSERSMFEAWMLQVESQLRHGRRDQSWMQPMVDARRVVPHTRPRLRRLARIWFSRFVVIVAFAIESLVVSAIALSATGR